MKNLSIKLLFAAFVLPTLVMLPVLVWPHYGLFSDAGQVITFPRQILDDFPQSLMSLHPLEDGRWNPLFHGLTTLIYAIVPDSPRALFFAQWCMFVGATLSLAWIVVKLTRNNALAIIGVILFCFGSAVFENFFTLDKVEPRITVFFAIASALLVAQLLAPSDAPNPAWRRFIAWQTVLGVLMVFSKETGAFLAVALVGTWGACKINPQWGTRARNVVGLAAAAHITVVVLFAVLFKAFSSDMTYRYVKYDVTGGLVLRNAIYYLATSPELALGVFCAIYWLIASFWRRLPGPSGANRVVLVFTSAALLAYVAGMAIWRLALDYYMLPGQFIASLIIALTAFSLSSTIFNRRAVLRVALGSIIILWLGFITYRIFLGSAIYSQDAAKDSLAEVLAEPQYHFTRSVLTLGHPNNAEIGERLKFFINRIRPSEVPVDLYNFWEPPSANRDNLQRFEGSVGLSPEVRQLREVAVKSDNYFIWQFGQMSSEELELAKGPSGSNVGGINWSSEDIWRASYLRVGDILVVPVGSHFLNYSRSRGMSLYRQSSDDFLRGTALKLSKLGGVRTGVWFTELGWDLFRVESITKESPGQLYGLALLLSGNAQTDITPQSSRVTLFEEHRLPDSGLLLGNGWHAVEDVAGNSRFRWMGDRSEVVLTNLRSGLCALEIDVEPMLQPGNLPFRLLVRGNSRNREYPLQGRQTIRFMFQADARAEQVVEIEALGGMTATPPNDARLLKARMFSLRLAGDCVSAQVPALP